MKRVLALVAAVALVACKAPTTKPLATEGTVAGGAAAVHLNSVHLRLRFGTGAVPGQVLLNGTVYKVAADGGLDVSLAAVQAARAHGGFTLIAPGYAPQVLGPNVTGEVAVAPLGASSVKGVTVSLPGNVIGYTPPVGPGQQTVSTGGSGGTGTGSQSGTGGTTGIGGTGGQSGAGGTTGSGGTGGQSGTGGTTGPGSSGGTGGSGSAPIAVGLLIGQAGPLNPGPFSLTIDLADWAGQPERAEAARRLLDGIHGLGAAGRAKLEQDGITLSGLVLTIKLNVDLSQAAAGHAEFPLPALTAMGVYLELTLTAAQLPAPGPTPGPTTGSTPLPTSANWGPGVANILSDLGSAVIGNNGAKLVGLVRVPLLPDSQHFVAVGGETGKYHLLTYTDSPTAAMLVQMVDQAGVPIGSPFVSTPSGAFVVGPVPATPAYVFLDCRGQRLGLAGIAPNPGAMVLRNDLDAATTAITDLVLDELRNNGKSMAAFNSAGYDADVAFIRNLLNQSQARWVVQANDVVLVAAFVRRLLAGAGHPVQAIPAVPAPARGTILRAFTTTSLPEIIKVDNAGNMWILNGSTGTSELLGADGSAIATLNAGGVGSTDLAFDPQGNAWLCNGNNTLMKFSPVGLLLQTVTLSWGPRGIGIDGKGDMWVSDPTPPQRFHHLTGAGVEVGTFTTGMYPLSVAFHPTTGEMWVTDEWIPGTLSRRSATGAPLASWTTPKWSHEVLFDASGDPWTVNGADPGSMSHYKPDGTLVGTYATGSLTSHAVFDDAGNIWAVNQKFDGGGNSVSVLKADGTSLGTYPVGNRPNGIAKDWAGNLLITDSFGAKIQVVAP
ncbi:MAG: repeat containing protein [Cyanobacteria bacterium RYN_339]|nr:repeat containing protein [Cyanobacteria bacterium RYN_339]